MSETKQEVKVNLFFEDYKNLYLDAKRLEKDADNPYFGSKYVQLKDVLAEAKRLCLGNNFIFIQYPDMLMVDDVDIKYIPILRTKLIHISGEEITAKTPLPVKNSDDPQKLGGAMTYMRRYSLTAILGLEEEDNDGNENVAKPKAEVDPQYAPKKTKKKCPICGKEHQGSYPKCLECWKKEKNGEAPKKTKKLVNKQVAPFPS